MSDQRPADELKSKDEYCSCEPPGIGNGPDPDCPKHRTSKPQSADSVSKWFRWLFRRGLLLIAASALTSGCVHFKSQSWDQENLKAHDSTCRTMVYHVNPKTQLLEQCNGA